MPADHSQSATWPPRTRCAWRPFSTRSAAATLIFPSLELLARREKNSGVVLHPETGGEDSGAYTTRKKHIRTAMILKYCCDETITSPYQCLDSAMIPFL